MQSCTIGSERARGDARLTGDRADEIARANAGLAPRADEQADGRPVCRSGPAPRAALATLAARALSRAVGGAVGGAIALTARRHDRDVAILALTGCGGGLPRKRFLLALEQGDDLELAL